MFILPQMILKEVDYMNCMSLAGSHHNYDNDFNQDSIMYGENERFCAMVLADGVSSCSESAKGAEIVCSAVTAYLLKNGERLFCIHEYEIAECITSHILYKLERVSTEELNDIEEYSSTVAFILCDRNTRKMLYFSIGDSLIIAVKQSNCSIVAMPGDSRNGCYVTTTEDAPAMAKTGIIGTENINSIIICSDGAWRLMYNRNRLHQDIKSLLIARNFTALKDILTAKERFDDCSFISVDLNKFYRREYQ